MTTRLDADLSRRRFLETAGGALMATPLAAASTGTVAAQSAEHQAARNTRQEARLGAGRPGQPLDQPDHAGLCQGTAEQAGRLRQRTAGEGQAPGAGLRGRPEEHLHLRQLRQPRQQPGHRRHLRRPAQQHASGVHHPRAQGRQARAVREADGQHAAGVRADDRGGQGGQSQADDRLPRALRAVQPDDDQDGAGQRRRWGRRG